MNFFWKLLERMKRHNGIPFDMPSPRMAVYRFAHQDLPALFFDDPEGLISRTLSDGGETVRRVWSESAAKNPYPRVSSADEVQIDLSEASSRRIVWITPPAPVQPTEPFYIALMGGEEESGVDCHYLVLELSEDGAGIFCEWNAEGTHLNRGALSGTTFPDFREAVLSGLKRSIK